VCCRSVVCVVGVYVLSIMSFLKDWLSTDRVIGLPYCITSHRMRDRNYCMAVHATPDITASLDYYGMHATHNQSIHMDYCFHLKSAEILYFRRERKRICDDKVTACNCSLKLPHSSNCWSFRCYH
jgi:hypothetical protein